MIRLFLIAFLASTGTFAGVWLEAKFDDMVKIDATSATERSKQLEKEFLTPDLLVVPIVNRTNLIGYLVCRLVFVVNPQFPAVKSIPEDVLLADGFYAASFKSHFYIPNVTDVPDMVGLADEIVSSMNSAAGHKRYLNVLIQQVDYFARTEVRQKVVESRFEKEKPLKN